MRTAAAPAVTSSGAGQPAEDGVLRRELAAVRAEAVAVLHRSDGTSLREMVQLVLGGLALGSGLLLGAFGLTGEDESAAGRSATRTGLVLSVLFLALSAWAMRPYVRRRVRLMRRVRVLRRRERDLVRQLPRGTAGHGIWWTYYGDRFQHPGIAVGLLVLGLLLGYLRLR